VRLGEPGVLVRGGGVYLSSTLRILDFRTGKRDSGVLLGVQTFSATSVEHEDATDKIEYIRCGGRVNTTYLVYVRRHNGSPLGGFVG